MSPSGIFVAFKTISVVRHEEAFDKFLLILFQINRHDSLTMSSPVDTASLSNIGKYFRLHSNFMTWWQLGVKFENLTKRDH